MLVDEARHFREISDTERQTCLDIFEKLVRQCEALLPGNIRLHEEADICFVGARHHFVESHRRINPHPVDYTMLFRQGIERR